MLRAGALRRVNLLSLLVTAGLVVGGLAGVTGVASAQGVGQQVRAADLATLRAIGVPAAWRTAKGRGVTVAVLDTGTSQGAPDLTGSVTVGPDYTAGANPPGYQPPHLHGTYISSIIAGHGSGPGRAEGMIGVAPQAKILSVRVILDDQEPGFLIYNENAQYDGAVAQGIRYAVRHGAGVINMSLGGPAAARSERQALAYAIARGVVVVAAAGNGGAGGHGFTPNSYPAAFTGVISVAAVGARGQHVSFSDRNASVVVSAPGVNVVGAGPGGSWLSGSGTSPASAFVAGVAALIRSRYPQLAPALVTQAIVSSAQRRPSGGYSPGVGFGEVDASAALAAAGKLAATRPAASRAMSAFAHFGSGASGPIVVAHHDRTRIAVLAVVAAVAAIGFLAAIVMLAVVVRRRRRRLSQPSPWSSSPPESLPASLPGPLQATNTAKDPDDIS
jgi:type VII secretion-associated serine protease mycosin